MNNTLTVLVLLTVSLMISFFGVVLLHLISLIDVHTIELMIAGIRG
jgi:hypothetical protein